MKKLIILAVFSALAKTSAATQTDPSFCQQDTIPAASDTTMKVYLTRQGGQMIFVQNDKMGRMTKDMTLKNGTVVKKDGSVTTKDGHSFELKEGDRVYMNGRIEGPSKTPN